VRRLAAEQGVGADEALARGLKEKSDEFARTGGALYS